MLVVWDEGGGGGGDEMGREGASEGKGGERGGEVRGWGKREGRPVPENAQPRQALKGPAFRSSAALASRAQRRHAPSWAATGREAPDRRRCKAPRRSVRRRSPPRRRYQKAAKMISLSVTVHTTYTLVKARARSERELPWWGFGLKTEHTAHAHTQKIPSSNI